MSNNRFKAAIILFSVAGPFGILVEFTASHKIIANCADFHSPKAALAAHSSAWFELPRGDLATPHQDFGGKEPPLGGPRKSCDNERGGFGCT
jgi:hypothetical protein